MSSKMTAPAKRDVTFLGPELLGIVPLVGVPGQEGASVHVQDAWVDTVLVGRGKEATPGLILDPEVP